MAVDLRRTVFKSFYKAKKITGATLIEVMIVMLIMNILVAMCSPIYADYIKKTKWTENINLAEGVSKAAMTCMQVYGASCSGATLGLYNSSDIGLQSWPTGKYIVSGSWHVYWDNLNRGFHVTFVGTSEVGGYHYDRGYSLPNGIGTVFVRARGAHDDVPDSMMAMWPADYF